MDRVRLCRGGASGRRHRARDGRVGGARRRRCGRGRAARATGGLMHVLHGVRGRRARRAVAAPPRGSRCARRGSDPKRAHPAGGRIRGRERRTDDHHLGRSPRTRRARPPSMERARWGRRCLRDGRRRGGTPRGPPRSGARRHESHRQPARGGRSAAGRGGRERRRSCGGPRPNDLMHPTASGRSNQERPRRPLRDERRSHRYVRGRLPSGARHRHLRRRRLLRGRHSRSRSVPAWRSRKH